MARRARRASANRVRMGGDVQARVNARERVFYERASLGETSMSISTTEQTAPTAASQQTTKAAPAAPSKRKRQPKPASRDKGTVRASKGCSRAQSKQDCQGHCHSPAAHRRFAWGNPQVHRLAGPLRPRVHQRHAQEEDGPEDLFREAGKRRSRLRE